MNTIYFPGLSEDGWITDPMSIADSLFSQFFESDYSQTELYLTHVSSMAWVIQECQGDILQTIILLRDTLQKYFSRYFNEVVVDVKDATSPNAPSMGALNIYLTFTDYSGVPISLGKMVEIVNSKINRVLSITNAGVSI